MNRSIAEVVQEIEEAPTPQDDEPSEGSWAVLAWADGRAVRFQELDGWAVTEGDILIGKIDEAERIQPPTGPSLWIFGGRIQGEVIVPVGTRLWPGRIPYTCEEVLKTEMRAAAWEWNDRVGDFLPLSKRNGEADYIHVKGVGAADGNWSEIGRVGKKQNVLIVANAPERTILHEIGHAAGLFHEHNRHDRDTYIQLLTDHIPEDKKVDFIPPRTVQQNLPPYDFDSIMHYRPWDNFGLGSLFRVTAGGLAHYGRQPGFTSETLGDGDVAALRALYGA